MTAEEYQALLKEKRSKYNNNQTEGFHSDKERRRYIELDMLMRAGEIRDLVRQKRFRLEPGTNNRRAYVADFFYFDMKPMCWVVEEVKGFMKADFPAKWRKMKRRFPDYLYRLNGVDDV